ncbi:NAD(P)/FAD-dependent oxidoreductase [Streptomyces sp. NPDC015661]|uniref:NAD(P)/FAD-dependent oxidoreductase n=1 Tax=Streptomyces sp. NPDC015661 TaxID=3364961 RepID=UPI0036F545E0
MRADVVVVGAGMFGSAAAKYLARAGADVLVIGPESPGRDAAAPLAAYGAHSDEARIVRRLGWDRLWGTLDARSADRLPALEAESGIDFFTECGALALMGKGVRDRTREMLRLCDAADVAVEEVSEAALRREFPDLGLPPVVGGTDGLLERRSAGYLNPRRMVRAQLALAARAGARLVRGAVTAVREAGPSGAWILHAESDGTEFTVEAEKVLVASGALVNRTGALPAGRELDVQAYTEPNLLLEVDEGQLERLRSLPTVVVVDPEDAGNDNLSAYLLPPVRYPDGTWYLRIGRGMQPLVRELRTAAESLSWCSAQTVTREQALFLRNMTRTLVPSLEPVSVRSACCVVDKTPTRSPYIGALDGDEGLSVVVGGNGHGARGSDEIGRLAATVVLGEAWDFPLPPELFAPRREPRTTGPGSGRPDYLTPPFGLC